MLASQLATLQLRYFLVKPRLLSGVMNSPQIRRLEAAAAGQGPRLFPPSHAVAREFAGLAEPADEADPLLLRCRLLQLAAKLFAEIAPTPAAGAPVQHSAQQRLDQLLQGMAEAEIASHTPQQLANLCGCSVRHFSRLFRQRVGCSLIARQIEIRLRRAERLLQESDAKVIDVALESGFQHVGLFNAMFKSRYRMTPSAWRQRAQSKMPASRGRLT